MIPMLWMHKGCSLCALYLRWLGRILGVLVVLDTPRAEAVEEKESAGLRYLQDVITTSVTYDMGFFRKERKQITVSGLLHLPSEGYPKPYPLLVFSHGSQDGGVEFRYDSLPTNNRVFLERGYAVFMPIRKGFNIRGMPASEIRADDAEPIACNNDVASDAGLKSAATDTLALLAQLKSRMDIDTQRITLMGQSRGGFLSLALAADGIDGVVLVLNFAGGWYSERCFGYFNTRHFETFGKNIRVPIMSFYGDRDSYYGSSLIIKNMGLLDKNGKHKFRILPGQPHSFYRNTPLWAPDVFK